MCIFAFFIRLFVHRIDVCSFLGCKNKNHGSLLKELMQTKNFRVTVVEELDVVEICGALKVSSWNSNKPRLSCGNG